MLSVLSTPAQGDSRVDLGNMEILPVGSAALQPTHAHAHTPSHRAQSRCGASAQTGARSAPPPHAAGRHRHCTAGRRWLRLQGRHPKATGVGVMWRASWHKRAVGRQQSMHAWAGSRPQALYSHAVHAPYQYRDPVSQLHMRSTGSFSVVWTVLLFHLTLQQVRVVVLEHVVCHDAHQPHLVGAPAWRLGG